MATDHFLKSGCEMRLVVQSVLLCALFAAQAVRAGTICVDDDNHTGIEDGSPAHPYSAIQSGIDAAAANDTVQIAGGAYAENLSIVGKPLELLAGFAGGTPALYDAGIGGNFQTRDIDAHPVNVSALAGDSVLTIISSGEFPDHQTRVSGLHLSEGTGHRDVGPLRYRGGGIFCTGGYVNIGNCEISNNTIRPLESNAETLGGGVYIDSPFFEMSRNRVHGNEAQRGGGVVIDGATGGTVENDVYDGNSAEIAGGGLLVAAPGTQVLHVQLTNNVAGIPGQDGWGGGLFVQGVMSCRLQYLQIHHNWASTHGGAVSFDMSVRLQGLEQYPLLANALIYRNVTDTCTGGAAVHVGQPGPTFVRAPRISQCTIAMNGCGHGELGNAIYSEFSQIQLHNVIAWDNGGRDMVGPVIGTGLNIEQDGDPDPLLANPGADDFHLRSRGGRWSPVANGGRGGWTIDSDHSPCIDAGGGLDGGDEPLPNGARLNLGFDGGTAEASKSTLPAPHDCDNDGRDDLDQISRFGGDCNQNGILDVCEPLLEDCNNNGIPDACEPDSDGDGVIDDCDPTPNGEPDNENDNGGSANHNTNSHMNHNDSGANENSGRPIPNANGRNQNDNAGANANANDNGTSGGGGAACPGAAAIMLFAGFLGCRRVKRSHGG